MSKLISNNQSPRNVLRVRSYRFSLGVIKMISTFPDKRMYWSISDQLLRSATSIGANIIEAKASSSKRDFVRFFEIALKSANETRYWLLLLKDSRLVPAKRTHLLIQEVEELSKMLAASILTMKGKRKL